MGYRNIVISSSVSITVKNEQLVIMGEVEGRVPLEDIRTLILESRASQISTYALSALALHGVCVYLCDDRHMPCALIQPIGQHSRQRKQLMLQLAASQPQLKQMWKSIVVAKIQNQAAALSLCGVDVTYIQKLLKLTALVQSGDKTNVESTAAAMYFRYLFGSDFTRSDDSAVNAALNYGYAIVRGYLARLIASRGFEPSIGIHHRSELNPFNLADDLIEPFRPLVDAFVFQNCDFDEFDITTKRELQNILNYEMLSGGEHHTMAYAAERLVNSLIAAYDNSDKKLLLPTFSELKRHEYE